MPDRVQLFRRRGWRMPPNTVKVDRSTKWGNPFKVGEDGTAAECVAKFRADIETVLAGPVSLHQVVARQMLRDIRAHNLACWCGPDDPCHADVLLDLANREGEG